MRDFAGALYVAGRSPSEGPRFRGYTEQRFSQSTPLGTVWCVLATRGTEESVPPPSAGTATNTALTYDGRLDNRDELAAASMKRGSNGSDEEIIANEFVTHGLKCFARLVGDFSIAVWDPSRCAIILARDPFGTRPLYYTARSGFAAWSTQLRSLLQISDPGGIDRDFVRGFLLQTAEWEWTPYQAIRRITPGYAVTISPWGESRERFWELDPSVMTTYDSDEDYEAEFRQQLRNAVSARMKSRTVLCELSGGLDSSSMVCLADAIVRESPTRSPQVHSVSFVYPEATADESEYREAVEMATQITPHHITSENTLLPLFRDQQPFVPTPLFIFNRMYQGVKEVATDIRADTVLSGEGGDHMLLNVSLKQPGVADMLRRGELKRAWSHVDGLHTQWHLPYASVVWSSAIQPLLPRFLRSGPLGKVEQVPHWMIGSAPNAERTMGRSRFTHSRAKPRSAAWEWQRQILVSGISTVGNCYCRELTGIDRTYPYLHRPLVEYMMSIPGEQKISATEMRSVQRRALRGILPEVVRSRKNKRGIGEVVARAIRQHWGQVLDLVTGSELATMGLVDERKMLEELRRIRLGLIQDISPLLHALAMESWLRHRPAQADVERSAADSDAERR